MFRRGHDVQPGIPGIFDQCANPDFQSHSDFDEYVGFSDRHQIARLRRIGMFAFRPGQQGDRSHMRPADLIGKILQDWNRHHDTQGFRRTDRVGRTGKEGEAHHRHKHNFPAKHARTVAPASIQSQTSPKSTLLDRPQNFR